MPVFCLVGGYANLVGWQRAQATGGPAGGFVADRLRRLLVPTAVWAGVWLAGELIAAILPGPHRWIWEWFPGYLVPLWFLGVYGLLILTVPVTATLHARHGARVLAVLAGLIAVGSVLGRGVGLAWADWVTAALVWLFCHQLGYAWRTWQLGRRPLAQRLAVTGAGLLALVVLTVFAGYPPLDGRRGRRGRVEHLPDRRGHRGARRFPARTIGADHANRCAPVAPTQCVEAGGGAQLGGDHRVPVAHDRLPHRAVDL